MVASPAGGRDFPRGGNTGTAQAREPERASERAMPARDNATARDAMARCNSSPPRHLWCKGVAIRAMTPASEPVKKSTPQDFQILLGQQTERVGSEPQASCFFFFFFARSPTDRTPEGLQVPGNWPCRVRRCSNWEACCGISAFPKQTQKQRGPFGSANSQYNLTRMQYNTPADIAYPVPLTVTTGD